MINLEHIVAYIAIYLHVFAYTRGDESAGGFQGSDFITGTDIGIGFTRRLKDLPHLEEVIAFTAINANIGAAVIGDYTIIAFKSVDIYVLYAFVIINTLNVILPIIIAIRFVINHGNKVLANRNLVNSSSTVNGKVVIICSLNFPQVLFKIFDAFISFRCSGTTVINLNPIVTGPGKIDHIAITTALTIEDNSSVLIVPRYGFQAIQGNLVITIAGCYYGIRQ
jgi:hypothetical protein